MWVLLIGITYAATFGSVHSHGNVSSQHDSSGMASGIEQAGFSPGTPLHDHSHSHECLICLLQLQLFNGALHKVSSTPTPQADGLGFTLSSLAPYFSVAHGPQRGRAPPLATLI